MAAQSRRFPRRVPMEARFADLLPEVLLGLHPDQFAAIAAAVLAPRKPPVVSTAHLHMPRTTVKGQAGIVVAMLRTAGRASWSEVSADCSDTYAIVAWLVVVMEQCRDKCMTGEQQTPQGEFYIRSI